jgi:hypothetical protein
VWNADSSEDGKYGNKHAPGTQELLVKRIGTKNEVIFTRFCNHFCLNAFALGRFVVGRELARKVA